MDTPTHALIPVIAYGLARLPVLRRESHGAKRSIYRNAVLLAVAAALPDLINPHVTLEERWHSWSHGLPAWLGFTGLAIATAWLRPNWLSWKWAVGMSIAYLSHLFGDAIAGGIAWAYPLNDSVIGAYYVPPSWWKPLDVACVVAAYVIFRVVPWRAKIHRRAVELAERRQTVLEEAVKGRQE